MYENSKSVGNSQIYKFCMGTKRSFILFIMNIYESKFLIEKIVPIKFDDVSMKTRGTVPPIQIFKFGRENTKSQNLYGSLAG